MKIQIFFLILLIFSISCGEEDIIDTDLELQPYFDLFAEEGAKRGIIVDYEASRIEGLIQDIPSFDVSGQCFHNEVKPNKVIVDIRYWEQASEEDKQFIVFHELGHCFLDRDHLDETKSNGTCVSIMHSSPGVCQFIFNDDTRDEYIDELFFQ